MMWAGSGQPQNITYAQCTHSARPSKKIERWRARWRERKREWACCLRLAFMSATQAYSCIEKLIHISDQFGDLARNVRNEDSHTCDDAWTEPQLPMWGSTLNGRILHPWWWLDALGGIQTFDYMIALHWTMHALCMYVRDLFRILFFDNETFVLSCVSLYIRMGMPRWRQNISAMRAACDLDCWRRAQVKIPVWVYRLEFSVQGQYE